MKQRIKCVLFDWAGTAVDYGCFAPVAAFVESFQQTGCPVTAEETRQFMGKTKIEETRALFSIKRVRKEFADKYGREPQEADITACYDKFQKILFTTLAKYSTPLPGVVETVRTLRDSGIRIGSTTGYTAQMMEIVRPAAAQQGYQVDCCITSDGMPGGRPRPYMIYKNLTELDIIDRHEAVKAGDTIADIREGVNAGVWSVGIILGSNELALSEEEVNTLQPSELRRRMDEVRQRMYAAGADYVIDEISQLPALIECINQRMNQQSL